jgi:hypothetical protein
MDQESLDSLNKSLQDLKNEIRQTNENLNNLSSRVEKNSDSIDSNIQSQNSASNEISKTNLLNKNKNTNKQFFVAAEGNTSDAVIAKVLNIGMNKLTNSISGIFKQKDKKSEEEKSGFSIRETSSISSIFFQNLEILKHIQKINEDVLKNQVESTNTLKKISTSVSDTNKIMKSRDDDLARQEAEREAAKSSVSYRTDVFAPENKMGPLGSESEGGILGVVGGVAREYLQYKILSRLLGVKGASLSRILGRTRIGKLGRASRVILSRKALPAIRKVIKNPLVKGGAVAATGAGVAKAAAGSAEAAVKTETKVAETLAKDTAKISEKSIKSIGTEVGQEVGKRVAEKATEKAALKIFAKKTPLLGLLFGLGFAAARAAEGDYKGASMEVASGALGTLPGVGTAASFAVDAAIVARDVQKINEEHEATNDILEKQKEIKLETKQINAELIDQEKESAKQIKSSENQENKSSLDLAKTITETPIKKSVSQTPQKSKSEFQYKRQRILPEDPDFKNGMSVSDRTERLRESQIMGESGYSLATEKDNEERALRKQYGYTLEQQFGAPSDQKQSEIKPISESSQQIEPVKSTSPIGKIKSVLGKIAKAGKSSSDKSSYKRQRILPEDPDFAKLMTGDLRAERLRESQTEGKSGYSVAHEKDLEEKERRKKFGYSFVEEFGESKVSESKLKYKRQRILPEDFDFRSGMTLSQRAERLHESQVTGKSGYSLANERDEEERALRKKYGYTLEQEFGLRATDEELKSISKNKPKPESAKSTTESKTIESISINEQLKVNDVQKESKNNNMINNTTVDNSTKNLITNAPKRREFEKESMPYR